MKSVISVTEFHDRGNETAKAPLSNPAHPDDEPQPFCDWVLFYPLRRRARTKAVALRTAPSEILRVEANHRGTAQTIDRKSGPAGRPKSEYAIGTLKSYGLQLPYIELVGLST